jgi:hypothetical protein
MRALIATVFSVAVLMSPNFGVLAQGAQPSAPTTPNVAPSLNATPNVTPSPNPAPSITIPAPGPSPTPNPPSSQSSSVNITPPLRETGRYHPCPASVGFGNGRSVCLGLDEPRKHVHVARGSRCWVWPLYSNSYSNWAY